MFVKGGDGGFSLPEITNSLRFDGTDDYVIRYFPTGTSCEYKWTYSVWVKRTKFASNQTLLSCYPGAGYASVIDFSSTDTLGIQTTDNSSLTLNQYSTAVYRDPAAWYHVVIAYDTQHGTQNLRLRIWVNNQLVVNPTLASSPRSMIGLTSNYNTQIGSYTGAYLFNGYMANACFVAGASKTPSDFAYTDPNGQWRSLSKVQLQSVVNSGGDLSWFLPFDDGASTVTLGNDAGANARNWTLTNMVRDGSVNDCWSYDTPTNNFTTANPLDRVNNATFSAGLLTASFSAINYGHAFCTVAIPSDTYWEVTAGSTNYLTAGVADTSNPSSFNWSGCWALYQADGKVYNNGAALTGVLATFTTNDVLGFAVKNNKLYIHKNGTWLNSGNPTAETGFVASGLPSTLFAYIGNGGGAAGTTSGSINFGQRPVASGAWDSAAGGYFRYTPPTGFKALCTKNLPIPSGAAANPDKHFGIILDTGNTGVAHAVTGINFQPGFLWRKARNLGSTNHVLIDSVRGVNKYLVSNLTDAEYTDSTVVTSFDANGFTLGTNAAMNQTGTTYANWLLKDGGAAVANNDGSISSQVSANVAAGFSIVTYTGTGANATVGHGLGAAPKMVIFKTRTGVAREWVVYHSSIGASDYLLLSSTAAKGTDSTVFNGAPTSSIFNVGVSPNVNGSAIQQVAYCFAEVPGFSKIGSYTGNGSADGPFVYCGFRPKWLLFKSTGIGTRWIVLDATRDLNNQINNTLAPNFNAAEYVDASWKLDFTANGFKVRSYLSGDTEWNYPGSTYIFMAFAEAPFKYANAR